MAVKYPTPEEVKQAFAAAFPLGQAFDPQRWAKLEHGVLDPTWQSAGDGIEVLEVAGARLFRVEWQFGIDKMNTSSETAMRSSAAALQKSFGAPQSEVKEGPVTIVRCWTRGIIG